MFNSLHLALSSATLGRKLAARFETTHALFVKSELASS